MSMIAVLVHVTRHSLLLIAGNHGRQNDETEQREGGLQATGHCHNNCAQNEADCDPDAKPKDRIAIVFLKFFHPIGMRIFQFVGHAIPYVPG